MIINLILASFFRPVEILIVSCVLLVLFNTYSAAFRFLYLYSLLMLLLVTFEAPEGAAIAGRNAARNTIANNPDLFFNVFHHNNYNFNGIL